MSGGHRAIARVNYIAGEGRARQLAVPREAQRGRRRREALAGGGTSESLEGRSNTLVGWALIVSPDLVASPTLTCADRRRREAACRCNAGATLAACVCVGPLRTCVGPQRGGRIRGTASVPSHALGSSGGGWRRKCAGCGAQTGPGRIVAVHHRSSALSQVSEQFRCRCF